jgi:hypothetical protein
LQERVISQVCVYLASSIARDDGSVPGPKLAAKQTNKQTNVMQFVGVILEAKQAYTCH